MHRNLLALSAVLLLTTTACGLKLTTALDEPVENIGCQMRTPIYIGSSQLSALYGRRWSDVELDRNIETETISSNQRYTPKSLTFFEVFYRATTSGEQRSTNRVGARLDVGTDSVGFANLYDGIMPLTFADDTNNSAHVFKTSFFGFEHTTTRTKETWELDVVIKDMSVTAVALTVPVMQRNNRTAFTSYTYSGHNQKLCVLDAHSH